MIRLFLLLCVLAPLANAADTPCPVVTLDPQVTQELALVDLGLAADAELVLPVSQQLDAELSTGQLTLVAHQAFPWDVIQTTAGDLLVRTSHKRLIPFNYVGQPGRQDVFLFGNFNGWNRESHPMRETTPGTYTCSILLGPGEHEYLMKVGDTEMRDPANPDSVGNGLGGWNSLYSIRDSSSGLPQLLRLGGTQNELRYLLRLTGEELGSFVRPAKGVAQKCEVFALLDNSQVPTSSIHWSGDTLVVKADNLDRKSLRVAVSLAGRGSPLQTSLLDPAFHWQDAVVYSLMPDRFSNGDTNNDNPVIHPDLLSPANWHGGRPGWCDTEVARGIFRQIGCQRILDVSAEPFDGQGVAGVPGAPSLVHGLSRVLACFSARDGSAIWKHGRVQNSGERGAQSQHASAA